MTTIRVTDPATGITYNEVAVPDTTNIMLNLNGLNNWKVEINRPQATRKPVPDTTTPSKPVTPRRFTLKGRISRALLSAGMFGLGWIGLDLLVLGHVDGNTFFLAGMAYGVGVFAGLMR